MPQQSRQGRDHQDQRQHLEGEGEQGALVGHGVGLIPARQIAEDEPGPLLGGQFQPLHCVVDGVQHHLGTGNGEGRQDQGRLHQHRADGQTPGEELAVLGQGPANRDNDDQAKQALQVQKAEHGKGGSATGRRPRTVFKICLNATPRLLVKSPCGVLPRQGLVSPKPGCRRGGAHEKAEGDPSA
ncbi:hypothetical protein D3C71_1359490 [compost metagenome]